MKVLIRSYFPMDHFNDTKRINLASGIRWVDLDCHCHLSARIRCGYFGSIVQPDRRAGLNIGTVHRPCSRVLVHVMRWSRYQAMFVTHEHLGLDREGLDVCGAGPQNLSDLTPWLTSGDSRVCFVDYPYAYMYLS